MLNWLRSKMGGGGESKDWLPAVQPPKQAFPFPVGSAIEAQEEIILMIPQKVIGENEKIGDVIRCHDDVEIALRDDLDAWLIKLKKGFRLSLGRSCQMMILADDDRPRKVKIRKPT